MLDRILTLIGEAIELEKTRIVCGETRKHASTWNKPTSTWIKHDGSDEVPSELRHPKYGDQIEVWICDKKGVAHHRSIETTCGHWSYCGMFYEFDAWNLVTHYRRPQKPEDA